jgi:hypothetical protein
MRGGRYQQGVTFSWSKSGTSGNKITVLAYKPDAEAGNWPVLDFGTRVEAGGGAWQVHDAGRKIWRTASSSYAPVSSEVIGWMDNVGQHEFQLQFYKGGLGGGIDLDNQLYSATGDYYAGPGVAFDGGRIYVRLQAGNVATREGIWQPTISDPGQISWEFALTHSYNMTLSGRSHVRFEGIWFDGCGRAIRLAGNTNNIDIVNCRIRAGICAVDCDNASASPKVTNILLDRIKFHIGLPPWLAWVNVKHNDYFHYAQEGALRFSETTSNVEVRNCHFYWSWDAVIGGEIGQQNIKIHHCLLDHNRDDGWQVPDVGDNFEFAHNKCIGSLTVWGWNRRSGGNPTYPGAKYIHHNIIDGRTDPDLCGPSRRHLYFYDNNLGGEGNTEVMQTQGPASGHGSRVTRMWSCQLYHNMIIVRHPQTGDGLKQLHVQEDLLAGVGEYGNIFNNILVSLNDSAFPENPANFAEEFDREMRIAAWTRVDGNVYWTRVQNPSMERFDARCTTTAATSKADFTSLAAFQGSAQQAASANLGGLTGYLADQNSVEPAWNATNVLVGIDGGDYRPVPGGPAASGAVDLGATGFDFRRFEAPSQPWPGLESGYIEHRGPLDPDGDGSELGPQ